MDKELLNQEKTEAKIKMTFEPEEVRKMRNRTYREYQKHLNLSGFRKGKVPYQIAQNIFGEGFLNEDIIETFIDENLEGAEKELLIESMGQPRLSEFNFESDGSLVMTIDVPLRPKLEQEALASALKEMEKFDYQELEGKELEEVVNRKKDQILIDFSEKTESDNPVEKGDYITIEVLGNTRNLFIPKVYSFEVGSENPNFSAQVQEQFIGREKEKPFKLNTENEKILVRVNKIEKFERPELTEEFIQENFFLNSLDDFNTIIHNIAVNEHIDQIFRAEGEKIFRNLIEGDLIEFSPMYVEDLEHGLNEEFVKMVDKINPIFHETSDKAQAALKFNKQNIITDLLVDMHSEILNNEVMFNNQMLHSLATKSIDASKNKKDHDLANYINMYDSLYNMMIPELANIKYTLDKQEESSDD